MSAENGAERKKNEAAEKEKIINDTSEEEENIPYASMDFRQKGKCIKQNRNVPFQCFPGNRD